MEPVQLSRLCFSFYVGVSRVRFKAPVPPGLRPWITGGWRPDRHPSPDGGWGRENRPVVCQPWVVRACRAGPERPLCGVTRRTPRRGARELKSPGRGLSIAWGRRPSGWAQGGRVPGLAPRGTPRGHGGPVGTYGLRSTTSRGVRALN